MAIHFDTQGPAPSGFHVPLTTEWQAVYDIWTTLGGGSSAGTNFGIALKLPFAGYRIYSSAGVGSQGTYGDYWSSSRYDANKAYCLYFDSFGLYPQSDSRRAGGYSVRCFKNTPVIPTSSWTTLYQGILADSGIFWSSTDGLISLSSDGFTWITIADKNLGATTVWNSGDTLSEANCGYYYQRGNNYGFPRTGSVTTSSTQVDASTYGPGNYYSSSTFITRSSSPYSWDSTDNGNLWGGVSQGTWETPDIKLHGAIQTFHRAPHYDGYLNKATIAYYPLTEDLLDHKDNGKEPINLSVSGSGYSFGTNGFGQAGVQLTGSTYFYPGSGNVWGKHPGTDDMTIAFRVSNYSPAAYGGSGSGYHCGILSFGRQFKTGIMGDGVLGKDVGILDGGYEGFSLDSNYVWSTTENPKTLNGVTAETYLNSYLSVVDTFHNGHHTRYISNIGADTPFCENDYASTKTVDVNYIGRDNYSSSNYRYFRGYMRDFVVAGDVWAPMMIRNYFNEDLGGYSPTNNTIAYYPFTTDVNDALGNYNGTVAGTDVTYGTVGGSVIKAAYLTSTRITTSLTTQPKTISFWLYKPSSSSDPSIDNRKQFLGFNSSDNGDGIRFRGVELNSSSGCFGMQVGNTLSTSSQGKKTDQRYNIIITTDNTNRYTYINGQLAITASGNFGTAETGLWLGTSPYDGISSNYNSYAYYSMLILENKTWTANEALAYYNKTKSNYGL